MYVSETARYLGASAVTARPPTKRHPKLDCVQRWRATRAVRPQVTLPEFLATAPRCKKHLRCGDNRLTSGELVQIPCPRTLPAPGGSARATLGAAAVCNDANSGLLIDCWQAAVRKGLSGLGYDQETLNRMSTAYRRLMHPGSLAGWNWTGNKFVWSGLGDDVPPPVGPSGIPGTFPGETYSPFPNLVPAPAPLPVVTADVLRRAAGLPTSPASVKAAAAQLPASGFSLASITSWLGNEAIAGTGLTYGILAGSGALLLLIAAMKRRGR